MGSFLNKFSARNWLGSLTLLLALSGFIFGCSHFFRGKENEKQNESVKAETTREPASQYVTSPVIQKETMSAKERLDLWHLSEGADVFPFVWFMKMKSMMSNQKDTFLYQKLDSKFGIVRVPEEYKKKYNEEHNVTQSYPMSWIGLTLAWSNQAPKQSDIIHYDQATLDDLLGKKSGGFKTDRDGKRSIGFVGTNCTFCHTNEMRIGTNSYIVEGAPNMMNVRGFFQDMFSGAAKILIVEKELDRFLTDIGYSEQERLDIVFKGGPKGTGTKEEPKGFNFEFRKALGLEGLKKDLVEYLKNEGFLSEQFVKNAGIKAAKKAFLNDSKKQINARVVPKYLEKLLKLSLKAPMEEEFSKEVQARMRFIATSIGGSHHPNDNAEINKDLDTPEGYSRVDAFGRIANLVGRKPHILLNSTTSIPYMWNMEYTAFFHWNANTNSIISRNIGQAFGLGAVLVDPLATGPEKFDSTTNIHNLHEMEKLLYKVRAPLWQDFDPKLEAFKSQADKAKLQKGCEIYQDTCKKCHSSFPERIGKVKKLIDYPVFAVGGPKGLGVDRQYPFNQATPFYSRDWLTCSAKALDSKPFREALFGFSSAVKKRYYERHGISPADQTDWERKDVRGQEYFRDTYLMTTAPQNEIAGVSTYKLPYLGDDSNPFVAQKTMHKEVGFLQCVANPGGTGYVTTQPTESRPGYPARNLSGVWATGPFLHNGSVPTVWHLLQPSSQRPDRFLVGGRTLDLKRLGYLTTLEELKRHIPELSSVAANVDPEKLDKQTMDMICTKYPAFCFDTEFGGNSNAGHEGRDFLTTPEWKPEDRSAVIDYLKVLEPEPEYARTGITAAFKPNSCELAF